MNDNQGIRMTKLAILPALHASDAIERLARAGIVAGVTREGAGGVLETSDGVYLGTDVTIYVGDTELANAQPIMQAYLHQLMPGGLSAKCRSCGYDLIGHAVHGICPECGEVFENSRAESRLCGKCGEEVPANFGVCWNCQSEVST